MRRYKTPEQLKQWRKDNGGLTHIGLYDDAARYWLKVKESGVVYAATGAADYEEIQRNEFLHRDHA